MSFTEATSMYDFASPMHQRRLPTMYELPSEEIGEPGLPDEFHRMQAELLRQTCQSPLYPAALSTPSDGGESEENAQNSPQSPTNNTLFIASDLNLYYDPQRPLLYKRPDWFMALDTPRLERQQDLRWSYVTWYEPAPPFLAIEFLSPGTDDDDLGIRPQRPDKPPRKWDVYEKFLQIPYYAVYDRYQNQFRLFRLTHGTYQEVNLPNSRFWFKELSLGLGIWSGFYEDADGLWLRWYDEDGQWIPSDPERAEQEKQRAEQEKQRAEQEKQRAEQEKQRAEQEKQRAEQEKQRAEQEKQRAEQAETQIDVERERIQQEQQRAEQAEVQVNLERERADQSERDYQALLKKLQDKGVDLDSL
ncbi:MAG: Uma2 family endonuclease [Cyanobacteria bacterium P01_F01_bin.150]